MDRERSNGLSIVDCRLSIGEERTSSTSSSIGNWQLAIGNRQFPQSTIGNRPSEIRDEAIGKLRETLEDHQRRRERRAGWHRRFIPTGLRGLDTALPHGGLPLGAVTEIVSDGAGVGAMTLAMRTLGYCRLPISNCQLGKSTSASAIGNWKSAIGNSHVVFIDTYDDFYPPAVTAFGLSLDRLIVVRPRNEKDALWATDQALRCSAVAAVIAPLRRLDERASRRLQLAAESSGVLGLILRPARDRVKTFAAVRMLVENCQLPISNCQLVVERSSSEVRQSAIGNRQSAIPRLCRITLLKVREGRPAEPILVDLHHETGDGPLPSVPLDRSAAAG